MIKIIFCGRVIDSVESDSLIGLAIKPKTFFWRLVLPANIPCLTLPIGEVSMAIKSETDWFDFKDHIEATQV